MARTSSTPTLATDRLLLRPLGLGDLDDVVSLLADPEVSRFVRRLDRRQAEARLRAVESEWAERGYGMFAAIDRGEGRFLGRAGLKRWPQFGETEVGWVLRRDAWGRGYATEAGRACIEWAFGSLGLRRLTSMVHPRNEASIRVARRLGMRPLRRDVLHGEPVIVFFTEPEASAEGAAATDR
jgi:RimJ/RimL family protein N-acetyltransferase